MHLHHFKAYVLIAAAAAVSACASMSPSHFAKFTFQEKVVDVSGKPVPNAWVKVRGWETLTDAEGRWKQVQVLHCGAMTEHPDSFTESDAILVAATGFVSAEEPFSVKHPTWFASCEPEQIVAFETVLKPENAEAREKAKEKLKGTYL